MVESERAAFSELTAITTAARRDVEPGEQWPGCRNGWGAVTAPFRVVIDRDLDCATIDELREKLTDLTVEETAISRAPLPLEEARQKW